MGAISLYKATVNDGLRVLLCHQEPPRIGMGRYLHTHTYSFHLFYLPYSATLGIDGNNSIPC